jgi:hypothetical protein
MKTLAEELRVKSNHYGVGYKERAPRMYGNVIGMIKYKAVRGKIKTSIVKNFDTTLNFWENVKMARLVAKELERDGFDVWVDYWFGFITFHVRW